MEVNETQADFGTDEAGEVRRWLLEINLAGDREKDWRKLAQQTIDRYRGKARKKNSFNILWSNTETIAPAVYNTTPKPDVRRRFKDADPVGKVASEMIGRALEFSVDIESFDHAIKNDVIDMLLASRATSRVRYIPSISGDEDSTEELDWEQCTIEHVQWDYYRIGPGKTWEEIPWVGFYHRMTRDQLIEKFGEEKGSTVTLDDIDIGDTKTRNDDDKEVFKTAGVWEIWCKDEKEVYFLSPNSKSGFLKIVPDPLGLNEFFPVPRPLYAIQDSSTMVPAILYEQYKEQADELDKVSSRINKLVDALKLRGVYDSTMTELSELLKGNDNDMIPAQNVAAMIEKGDISKSIWFMPIDMAASVLKVLFEQREACKAIIYEITGISDIRRGASDPNETLGAQQLKAQFSNMRISSMQREVQRYIRDLIRIMSEVISTKFQPQTLLQMTGLQIPTNDQIAQQQQQMMMQYQQVAQQAQQSGQQPPPPPQPPQVVTLEQVMSVVKNDMSRMFKIDVETDSTIAATIEEDVTGLTQVLTGVTEFMQGVAPLVSAGAFPIEAAKEIVMTICRRSRMGSAVEDALDKIQAPTPPPDPEQAKMQAQAQLQQQQQQHDQQIEQGRQQFEQQKMQMEFQLDQQRVQSEKDIEQFKQSMQAQQVQHQNMIEAQRETLQAQNDAKLEAMRQMHDAVIEQSRQQFELLIARLGFAKDIEVAEIGKETTLESAQISAAKQAETE